MKKVFLTICLTAILVISLCFGASFAANAADDPATDGVPGDITADGLVNAKDLLRARKYFAGWSVEVDTVALDANGDGTINAKDLLRLRKFFAGWDVEIFYGKKSNKTHTHAFGEWVYNNNFTHKRTCTCGQIETVAHTWNDGVVTKEATHSAEGEKTYTCAICGATKVEKIEKLQGHTFGAWTSADDTNHKRTCACGEVETMAHTWNDGVVTKEATHLAEGEKTCTCTVCGATKVEKTKKTEGHIFSEWICNNVLKHKRTCACGRVEMAAHTWDVVVTKEATCLVDGEKNYTCTICGATKVEKIEKLQGHTFGKWTSVDAASHTRICACGENETAAHIYDDDEDTTCNECGYVRTIADVDIWDGTIAESFESGTGAENDPYIIKTSAQLAYLAKQVNSGTSYSGYYFKLANNLYLNDTANWKSWKEAAPSNAWTPIGSVSGYTSKHFSGVFDGYGYRVYGIYIGKSADYQGLFGTINGTVKNLGVEKSYICGNNYVGGVCGYNYGTISNCYNTGAVSGSYYVGGVCGQNYEGTITGCYNTGAVSGSSGVGGVCGRNYEGTITACYNAGTVSGSSSVGGVCGDNRGVITACYNTGTVSGSYEIGGVCGANYEGTITSCYNTGAVIGNERVGGVCGNNDYKCTITSCYNAGTVSGSYYVGGVCGVNWEGTITSSYYLMSCAKDGKRVVQLGIGNKTKGKTTADVNGKTKGLSADAMKLQASFAGFDFNSVWTIGAITGYDYPTLIRHTHTFGEWAPDGATTHKRVCACGQVETEAHTWNDGVITKEATHFAEGEKTYTCTICGATKIEKIKDLQEHTVGVWTMLDETNHARTCVCGEIETAEHVYDSDMDTTCDECGYVRTVADITIWDGTVAEGFASGTGTKSDPYIIKTGAQLAYLAKQVNAGTSYEGCYFELVNDLYLNNTVKWKSWRDTAPSNTWTPIGTSFQFETYFAGIFDGHGYNIYGVYINNSTTTYQGLFGCSNGKIQNLGIERSYIYGKQYTGGVCGSNGGIIRSCHNTGIVGGESTVGGVCGDNWGGTGTVTACYNTGSISGNSSIGGICGNNWSGTVVNCYNEGAVSGSGNNIGGVCGHNCGTIKNCYNTGTLKGSSWDVGGICGYNEKAISKCYNIGVIRGHGTVGGVCGDGGTITNCYYLLGCAKDDNETVQYGVGSRTQGGATTDISGNTMGLADAQMKMLVNFVGFDFENAWEIEENGYPTLRQINSHVFGAWTSANETTHKRTCSCGATETAEHIYDDDKDTTCNECDYVRIIQKSYSEGLAFTSCGSGICTVSGIGTCTDAEIVIPEKSPAGDVVVAIGAQAFAGCTSIVSVEMPETILIIGNYAFDSCTALCHVAIPSAASLIGNQIFRNCGRLSDIEIGEDNASYCAVDGVVFSKDMQTLVCYPGGKTGAYAIPSGVRTVASYAFAGCDTISSVTIPASVETLENYAFNDVSKLTSVTFEEGSKLTSIGTDAFGACFALENIEIPESVTEIGDGAFYHCAMEEIRISSAVQSIGAYAFSECDKLKAITVDADNSYYRSEDGVLFDKNMTTLVCYPAGKEGTSYSIPESVTAISDGAFRSCQNLVFAEYENGQYVGSGENPYYALIAVVNEDVKTFKVHSDTKIICGDVFHWCTSLKAITIPSGVLHISADLFENCTELTYNAYGTAYYLGNSQNLYQFLIKAKNTSVLSCTVHAGTTVIASGAFASCDKLQSIVLPSSVMSIDEGAFYGCTALGSVSVPSSVTSIGAFAFQNCTSLSSISIPSGVTSIGEGALYGCGNLKSITIPSGVTEISDQVLFGCSALESIEIPSNVRRIGYGAFGNCDSLTEILIPSGVTEIGDHAFHYCSGLASVTFGEDSKIAAIGEGTFAGCVSLQKIALPLSVQKIGFDAFYRCESLADVSIPSGLTEIGEGAFSGCGSLTGIHIPAGVVSIGDDAFKDCHSLASIYVDESNPSYCTVDGVLFDKNQTRLILYPAKKTEESYLVPASVDQILHEAFSQCESLTALSFAEGSRLTDIGDSTFYGCKNLAGTVAIPAGVVRIGKGAFTECQSLEAVSIPASVADIGVLPFASCISLQSVSVDPENAVYCSVDGILFDKDKETLLCYPAGKSDESYTVPGGVTSIGYGAFCTCDHLASVVLPFGVTTIGEYAFMGSASLASIEIPASVVTIGEGAFRICGSLETIRYQGSSAQWQAIEKGDKWNEDAGACTVTFPEIAQSVMLNFASNGDGTCMVADIGDCADTVIIIPEKSPLGDTVTGIGDQAFWGCGTITSISIPASVVSIGTDAFVDCMSLAEITVDAENTAYGSVDGVLFDKSGKTLICYPSAKAEKTYTVPADVETVGDGAFYGASALVTAELPTGLTKIGEAAFFGCASLTNISVPAGVSSIGNAAFYACERLAEIAVDAENTTYSSVDGVLFDKNQTTLLCYPSSKTGTSYTIPTGVSSIAPYAFWGCQKLTDVTLDENSVLTDIGMLAFGACSNLTEIDLPASLVRIGEEAFSSCGKLSVIAFLGSEEQWKSVERGNGWNTGIESYKVTFAARTSSKGLAFTSNGDGTCYVSGIGDCTDTEIVIPEKSPAGDTVTEIGSLAFKDCSNLVKIIISSNIVNVGEAAFKGCSGLMEITLSSEIASISCEMFSGCSSLSEITIPASVSSIDVSAFSGCVCLENIFVDSKNANYDSMDGILIEKNEKKIVYYPTRRAGAYTIPSDIMGIGDFAFSGCTKLTSVLISANVDSIGVNAFLGCEKLSSINVAQNNDAYCAVEGVLFSKDKTKLLYYPGAKTENEYVISSSVTDIENGAFADAGNLSSITVYAENPNYCAQNGILYSKDMKTLICYPKGGIGVFSAPVTIVNVAPYAFFENENLFYAFFEWKLENIGNYAFYHCSELEEIGFRDTKTQWETIKKGKDWDSNTGNYNLRCFASEGLIFASNGDGTCVVSGIGTCKDTYVMIPHRSLEGDIVTGIGDKAFYGCNKITDIEFSSTVTTIGEKAFWGCTSLSYYFNIPEAITSIGDGAFSFTKICGVSITSNVTRIGKSAFEYCIKLKEVRSKDSSSLISIGERAFLGCSALEKIEIPASVTSIGDEAFYACSKLMSITIPASVQSIGDASFNGCSQMDSIQVDEANEAYCSVNGVLFSKDMKTLIQYPAKKADTFYTVPTGVEKISDYAFAHCNNLQRVVFDKNCQITNIGAFAFSECGNLLIFEIPQSVIEIGRSIFANCISLTSVTIQSNHMKLGSSVFSGCSAVTNITFKGTQVQWDALSKDGFWYEDLPKNYNLTFTFSTGLLFVSNQNGTCKIGGLGTCTDTNIVIPKKSPAGDMVTGIADAAFKDCSTLISIAIPSDVTKIGTDAFLNCNSLTSIAFGGTSVQWNSVEKGSNWDVGTGSYSFLSAALEGLKFISGENGECSVEGIKETIGSDLIIPGISPFGLRVTGIVDRAFCAYSNITSVSIHSNVTTIGESAFHNCDGIASIVLPLNLTYIGKYAFYDCDALTSIWIPSNVSTIQTMALSACNSLSEITVAEENANYCSIDGVLFSKDQTTLISYPAGSTRTSYAIPYGVVKIEDSAFDDANLTSVEIPSSVMSIGKYTFCNCRNLVSIIFNGSESHWKTIAKGEYWDKNTGGYAITYASDDPTSYGLSFVSNQDGTCILSGMGVCTETEIIIPTKSPSGDTVTSIGAYAFRGCSSLTSIEIPSSVTSIGSYAFRNCSSLTSVTFEKSSELTSIGAYAFHGCSSLTSIEIPSSVTSIGTHAFWDCSSLTSVALGENSELTSIEGGVFYNCSKLTGIEIPSNVTSIGNDAFRDCSSLTSVTFEKNSELTSIGDYAFWNCGKLTGIEIPSNVTSIGNDAFRDCSSLTSITIPSSVTSIGNDAFRDCSSLTSITIPSSVTSIGDRTFYNCRSLTSITIPLSVTNIGSLAFYNCDNFATAIFNGTEEQWNAIQKEADWIQSDSEYFTYMIIYMATHVHAFGEWTRVDNTNHQRVCACGEIETATHTWNDGVVTKETTHTVEGEMTYTCTSCGATKTAKIDKLTDHTFGEWSPYGQKNHIRSCACGETETAAHIYDDDDDMICNICGYDRASVGLSFTSNGDGTCSVNGIGTCTDTAIVIPTKSPAGDTVTSIGDWALDNCWNLTSVMIPSGVTSIGAHAFWNCSSLTSVTIPSSVTSIGNEVFFGCSKLTSITIPSSVTSIEWNAFRGCSSLTSVTIPSSVTSIGRSAFYNCSSLTSIEIPSSVTSIGWDAFGGCSSLTSITFGEHSELTSIGYRALCGCSGLTSIEIPSSVTSIGEYAFSYCSSLTSITIPSSVTSIGYEAFRYCSSLTSIEIPSSVTSIGTHAFWDCSSLTSITIPSSVTCIEDYVFEGCGSLTSITIPSSVTSIEEDAFYGCSSLTSITVDANNNTYSSVDGVLFNKAKTSILCYPAGKKSYTIPSSVTSIGETAFYGCSSLTSIEIPSSVTSIGYRAFYGCSNLTSITISSSVKSIGAYAFQNCSGLTSIKFIGTEAQWNAITKGTNWNKNTGTYTVTFEPPVFTEFFFTSNGDGTCYVSGIGICTNTAVIPTKSSDGDTVTSIGQSAFSGCKALTSIEIPSSVKSIGQSAFSGCKALTSIMIPSSVTSIGQRAFSGREALTSITIPSSVTSIESGTFGSCTNLTSVIFEANSKLTNIANNLFAYCSSLVSIKIPEGVTEIGSSAFLHCRNLKSVEIPTSVLKIGEEAFYYCDKLSEIAYAGTKEQWSKIAKFNDWNYNTKVDLEKIGYSDGLSFVSNEDGTCILSGIGTCKDTSVSIPLYDKNGNLVTSIGDSAFKDCISITSITIPSSVTSIGNSAFQNCSSLNPITLPPNVTRIGDAAFKNCSKLNSITIPSSVTSIGDLAFSSTDIHSFTVDEDNTVYCDIDGVLFSEDHATLISYPCAYCVASYTIPSGVTSIGANAFRACGNTLTTITIPSSITSIGENAFYMCRGLTSITIPSGVVSIGDGAFRNCSGITKVEFSSSVTSIGESAFFNCTALSVVSFAENSNLEKIGHSAFYGCSKLVGINIPKSVTSIGESAFCNCNTLSVVSFAENGNLENICDFSFYDCGKLVSMDIPDGVTSIGKFAFCNCSKLVSVTLPSSLTELKAFAFQSCTSLARITFNGTQAQWDAIKLKSNWAGNIAGYQVIIAGEK